MNYSSDIEKGDKGIGKTLRMEEGNKENQQELVILRSDNGEREETKLIHWLLVEELRG